MPVDFGVFERQKTILDQQQLQDAFNLKKALAIQSAQKDALETQALQAQAANGGLTLKDMLSMQLQQQNAQEDREFQRQNAEANRQLQQQSLQERLAAQRESQQFNNELRRAQMAQSADLARANMEMRGQTLEDKKTLKMRTDQNLLAGALDANQQQIQKINNLFNPDGTLKSDVARNFGFGQISNKIPGTPASDAQENLKNINANSFIQALGLMKSQSATGASGLGALSEREGDKVQSAAAALGGSQSAESFAKNARAYQAELKAANERLKRGFQNIYGQQGDVLPAPQVLPPPPTFIDPAAARAELERRAAARRAGGQ